MIDEKRDTKLSKYLSLLLRHAPERIGLELDSAGWANVVDLIARMNENGQTINFEILEHLVATNNKKRFAFNQDKTKIRANQGHSIAVDHGYAPIAPPAVLYHGTAEKNEGSILKVGLDKRKRHHVHLSQNIENAIEVGKRHGKPIVLEIDAVLMYAEGFSFFKSENDVWLTDHVPVKYIKKKG